MESHWLQGIERSLRRERNLDVKRTVHIMPQNETRDEFMDRHLTQLEDKGVGKFSAMNKRGVDKIQWRCERATKCKGKSTGDPATTRANSCGAYVSFTFVDKNTFNSCIVRLKDKHSGHHHDVVINNPQEGCSDWIVGDVISDATAHQLGDSNGEISAQHTPSTTTTAAAAATTNTDNTTATTTTSHTTALALPTPSTHHHTATPNTSTPTIFKEIAMILPCLSGGKKRRCNITVEELGRRIGPPERMSFTSLVAYLRADNNMRKELQAQLEVAGIRPNLITAETSLFSQLCEEEVDALSQSLAGLVQSHLPFEDLSVIPEAEDEDLTLGRLLVFKSHLRRGMEAIKNKAQAVDLASHGFMSKMLDLTLSIFDKCIENQMNSLKQN